MRVIKFRQWTGDRFYYWGFGASDDGSYFTGPSSGGNLRVADQAHEQFTGLTDANGVEIYEGDIVASNAIAKPGAEVVYLESDACFSIGPDWPITEYKVMHYPEPLVVIGNIHQNPELLEADNV